MTANGILLAQVGEAGSVAYREPEDDRGGKGETLAFALDLAPDRAPLRQRRGEPKGSTVGLLVMHTNQSAPVLTSAKGLGYSLACRSNFSAASSFSTRRRLRSSCSRSARA
jgi:hypothetical protein